MAVFITVPRSLTDQLLPAGSMLRMAVIFHFPASFLTMKVLHIFLTLPSALSQMHNLIFQRG